MKTLSIQLKVVPAWLKVLAYFLILSAAIITAGAVPVLNDFIFFFAVCLLMSWLFLRTENLGLLSLGFAPTNKQDATNFFSGIMMGALMLISTVALTLYLTKDAWTFNPHVDPIFMIVTFFGCLWSVFVQEFVFRGYPFQTLLKHYSPWVAQLLIAIPFGIMHFGPGMSSADRLTVILTTGTGSVLFGLAYLKTKKLMLPIGIHLGWNYFQALLPRTAGSGRSGLIIIQDSTTAYNSLYVLLPYFAIMAIAILLLNHWKSNNPTKGVSGS